MLNPSQLESMAQKIVDIIPQGFGEMPSNMQAQLKSVLSSTFDKMDLVTREEFDVQIGVLAKTRAKLEQLEKQVAELEQHINAK